MKKFFLTLFLLSLCISVVAQNGPTPKTYIDSDSIASGYNLLTDAEKTTATAGDSATAFTPTITPGTGTATTVTPTGLYTSFGKWAFLNITVTVTDKGTAGGSMSISLPAGMTVAQNCGFGAISVAGSSAKGLVYSAAGLSYLILYKDGLLTPFNNGDVWRVTGIIPIQ